MEGGNHHDDESSDRGLFSHLAGYATGQYPPSYGAYPPPGYPPQGYLPQGYPPQAYSPAGYPPACGYPPAQYPFPGGYPPAGYPGLSAYPAPGGYPPAIYPGPSALPLSGMFDSFLSKILLCCVWLGDLRRDLEREMEKAGEM
ncbi:annexin A7-like [Camellia sinensis]|uniref:annexin A7-like n=1 Tax=Camellia sinensis TaxID=4442 RepID=UPI00103583B8|nr:annexin A7-like [Camellia sinensis]